MIRLQDDVTGGGRGGFVHLLGALPNLNACSSEVVSVVDRLRVLGIDPGLTRCGVGVVDGPPSQPRLVHHDVVRTSPEDALEQRLLQVHDAVAALVAEHRPTFVAIERVLFSNNVRTAMATGQALGVAMLAAAQAGLVAVQLTPTDVKASVAGHGGADKDAVARMVVAQLGLSEAPRPVDVTDAIAVALAALARGRLAAATAAPADADGGGSWESLIAARGLRVAGGTT